MHLPQNVYEKQVRKGLRMVEMKAERVQVGPQAFENKPGSGRRARQAQKHHD